MSYSRAYARSGIDIGDTIYRPAHRDEMARARGTPMPAGMSPSLPGGMSPSRGYVTSMEHHSPPPSSPSWFSTPGGQHPAMPLQGSMLAAQDLRGSPYRESPVPSPYREAPVQTPYRPSGAVSLSRLPTSTPFVYSHARAYTPQPTASSYSREFAGPSSAYGTGGPSSHSRELDPQFHSRELSSRELDSRNSGGTTKICFLDVDGVLHPYSARSNAQLFNQSCMYRLKRIIEETDCQIVLSSSWRQTAEARSTVTQQLRAYGIDNFIDCTRIRHDEYQRHEDILDWVQKHPGIGNWIAIDDLPMYHLRHHYIQTMPETGLTDQNVREAIRVLNN